MTTLASSCTASDLKEFVDAVIEALFFTDGGPDGEFSSSNELAPSARRKIEEDAALFLGLAGDLIPNGCSRGCGYSDMAMAGHDFWLTRNGHGAGFWDGDWETSPTAEQIAAHPGAFPQAAGVTIGDALSDFAKRFGSVDAYLGDDGLVYLS